MDRSQITDEAQIPTLYFPNSRAIICVSLSIAAFRELYTACFSNAMEPTNELAEDILTIAPPDFRSIIDLATTYKQDTEKWQ